MSKRRANDQKRKPHHLFLGVDGGGTKTHAVLMNAAKEFVCEGFAGPSNPLRVGLETAVANIATAVNAACDNGSVSVANIAGATLGLAGVRRADLRRHVRASFIQRLRISSTVVVTDAEIALYGTTLGKPGLVVIAGTGSICLGKNEKGEIAIAGGWGPLAGDEGGGIGIARAALQAVAKASDGRGLKTQLSEMASEYFRASGPENLIVAIYSPQIDNTRIAGFARYVVDSALDGDRIAVEIIEDAGRELGSAAVAVISKLKLQRRKVPIGCVGGIFHAGEILTVPMLEIVHKVAPNAFLTEPLMPPAHAAALMALRNGKNSKNGIGR